jgi:hypothetical protein
MRTQRAYLGFGRVLSPNIPAVLAPPPGVETPAARGWAPCSAPPATVCVSARCQPPAARS